jgi:hypothetical protein
MCVADAVLARGWREGDPVVAASLLDSGQRSEGGPTRGFGSARGGGEEATGERAARRGRSWAMLPLLEREVRRGNLFLERGMGRGDWYSRKRRGRRVGT